MRAEHLMRELLEVARRSGIRVRREHGRFRGGYCIVREQRLILLNRALPPEQVNLVLAEALRWVPLEHIPMKPAVRAWLEEALQQMPHGVPVLDVSAPQESNGHAR